MARLPIVYVLFRYRAGDKSPRFGGFAGKLVKAGVMPRAEYRTLAIDELTYTVSQTGEAKIYDQQGVQVLHDADFVYFKSWERMPERAAAIACYLKGKGIDFEDGNVQNAGTTKLSQTFKLWAAGCRVIPTIVGKSLPSDEIIAETLGTGQYLIKPIRGEKGGRTIVVDTIKELRKAIEAYGNDWMAQQYLPNNGDYRVFVYGYKARGAMLRKGGEGAVVNNTSRGATSEHIATEDLNPQVAKLARKAALAVGNSVAGVDVLPAGDDLYVLEVNQGSQIVTGHFTQHKMQAFGDYMHERLSSSYKRTQAPSRLRLIGRNVHAGLPEFDMAGILAKVDTGAYQSALHATNIRQEDRDGQKVLVFNILDGHKKANGGKECIAHEYDMARVVSSNGHEQMRYRIKTYVSIYGVRMKTKITLTDRSDMTLPMLLGRQFLRGRYMVNVELSRKQGEEIGL